MPSLEPMRRAGVIVALLGVGLAGCSYVPDAANPVNWYKELTGAEPARQAGAPPPGPYPDIRQIPERPQVTPPEERRRILEGLVADRANARYVEEPIGRDGTATAPLPSQAKPPSPPAAAPTAGAPSMPPAALTPAPARSMAPLRTPAPPSSTVRPPPSEPVRTTVARPATAPAAGDPTRDAYRRRLAESGATKPLVAMAATPAARAPDLTPPAAVKPPVAQRAAATSSNSFLVASFVFPAGSDKLSSGDRTTLTEVARLARQGAVVRIIGRAPVSEVGGDIVGGMVAGLDLAMQRANAIAKELRSKGVPARRISLSAEGAEGAGSAFPNLADEGRGTEIYLDY